MKDNAVVILSGGADSTTLVYELVASCTYNVYPITFDYGQKHKKEIEAAKRTCSKLGLYHEVFDLSDFSRVAKSALTTKQDKVPDGHYADETMKQTVVPNRNMVMLSIAGAYAISLKANYLYYGAHSGDHAIYPDCRPKFVEAMGMALEICDYEKIVLLAPYLYLNKAQIIKRGLRLKVDYKDTWTCYKGQKLPCGTCGSCSERLEAFAENGVSDPLMPKK